MSAAVIASELAACAALWPSLNPQNPAVLEAYREVLLGFSDEELRAGFRRVRQTHEGVSFPKPATIAAMCAGARNRYDARPDEKRARADVDANGCEIKCSRCGTVTLYHERREDGGLGRLFPWHADDCPLRRADNPRNGESSRIVWPQPRNGGMYRAPIKELVQQTARRLPAA